MTTTICQSHHTENVTEKCLHLVFELSKSKWKLGTTPSIGQKPRIKDVVAGDLQGVLAEIAAAKVRFGLPQECPVYSCFEAGRDGFWIDRWLRDQGIISFVIDPASIQQNRRKKQAKTDRIDVRKLLSSLIRHLSGERCCSVVQVPSEKDEDDRQINRELEALKGECQRHRNRITSLLFERGFRIPINRHFVKSLNTAVSPDGRTVSDALKARVLREFKRLQLALSQIADVMVIRREAKKRTDDPKMTMVRKLERLSAFGENSSWLFVAECFGWRTFDNRKQVGSFIGLTPTPWDSGEMSREQGIDKAGNARIRWMAIQIAWRWLQYQPNSALSMWYQRRFAQGDRRTRKIGIVALTRKLLIAVWRYLHQDILPEGAALKA